MTARTFAIGDIHGDRHTLTRLLSRLPPLEPADTLVFLGDYLDRGPDSAGVVALLRDLPQRTPAKVVTLRGNHEDGWLRAVRQTWLDFTFPRGNGCLATLRSYAGTPAEADDTVLPEELEALHRGLFFPADVLRWLDALPFWYEDEHALYVHAGLVRDAGRWPHPREVTPPEKLLWVRPRDFFSNYAGKPVVVGHTVTSSLPAELSTWTPEDPTDLWAGPGVTALDTGCGGGGFLTALELPARRVYESRDPPP